MPAGPGPAHGDGRLRTNTRWRGPEDRPAIAEGRRPGRGWRRVRGPAGGADGPEDRPVVAAGPGAGRSRWPTRGPADDADGSEDPPTGGGGTEDRPGHGGRPGNRPMMPTGLKTLPVVPTSLRSLLPVVATGPRTDPVTVAGPPGDQPMMPTGLRTPPVVPTGLRTLLPVVAAGPRTGRWRWPARGPARGGGLRDRHVWVCPGIGTCRCTRGPAGGRRTRGTGAPPSRRCPFSGHLLPETERDPANFLTRS